MNKLKILYGCLAALLLIILGGCSKEGSYKLTETPPLDFRTHYDGLTLSFVNAVEGTTNVSWNFGDNETYVQGDSVVHTYATIGNYVITMKGTLNGVAYTMHTVQRVDKASVVRLDDGTFDDWNGVNYPDFQLTGKANIDTAKVDYDANNVYFLLEYTSNSAETDKDNMIIDIFIDSDNSAATGLTLKGLGCDYLVEGNPVNWIDPYIFAGTSQSDWNFAWLDKPGFFTMGTVETNGEVVKMEFSISREVFKITKDVFQFALTIMDSNWSDYATVTTADLNDKITVMMDKQ